MNKTLTLSCLLAALAGCSSNLPTAAAPMSSNPGTSGSFMQDSLPAAIQVPAGNKVALQTVGTGEIAYQCREKQGAAGNFEWVFLGPNAILSNRAGAKVGTYYGPPATWESTDGSKVTATQVAVAPAGTGNIPYQLVKANPAMGQGAMSGITYIQRVATRGGVAPAATCDASSTGRSSTVKYQADYIFWSAS